MKPIHLSVKGFGPYVEEQQIDFRRLKDAALYLITGPTGAGKTTLLDAICFGLYGDSSGGGRDGRQMRSDYLQPSQDTEIVLDFDIGPESYRVKRSPAQVRPKLRGNGTTLESATATLWRRTGTTDPNSDGEVIAVQPTNVTEAVTTLLGFECNQFRQVILLPQGEFRKFLSASSGEREQILEVLFQTEIFRQIEEVLKSKAKSIEEEIRDARQRLDNFLEAAQATSEHELQQRKESAQLRSQEIDGQLATARRTETNAQKAVDVARATAAKLDELTAAEAALGAVQSKQAAIETIRKDVTAARKAEQLLDMERSAQERVREHVEAEAALETLQLERALAERAELSVRERLAAEEQRQEERAEAGSELQSLSGLRERVEKIALAEAEFESAQTQHQVEFAKSERLESEERNLERKITEREDQLAALLASAQRGEALSLTEQKLDTVLRNRLQLDRVRIEVATARDRFDKADARFQRTNESLQVALQNLDQVQAGWISAQSAILAQDLSSGCPCPVCGSPEHPAPASSDALLPDENNLKRLRAEVRELQTQQESQRHEISQATNEVTRLETTEISLAAQLGEAAEATVPDLKGQLAQVQRGLSDASHAGEEASVLAKLQTCDRESIRVSSAQLGEARSSLQGVSDRLAAARQALAERQDGIPGSLRTVPLIDAAIKTASARVQSLTDAYEAARSEAEVASLVAIRRITAHETAIANANTATERRRDVEAQFHARLVEMGFSDLAEFGAAKAEISRVVQLENEIRQFEDNLAASQSRFDRARECAVGLNLPDLEDIQGKLVEAKDRVAALVAEQMQSSEEAKTADRFLNQINESREKLQLLEATHSIYGKIANVAGGANQMRVTFQRFVQGTIFENVLRASSVRLSKMSKGRFELQRLPGASNLRQSGGLDIVVHDSYTGTTRPVSSLSGGEGFMASLSLALGLADVVQNHAGGLRLESLFIDEGFGSLDTEALDKALEVLMELRQAGRLIGVISHVSELKERINTRIEVEPQARGSIARIIGGIPVNVN